MFETVCGAYGDSCPFFLKIFESYFKLMHQYF